MKVTHPHFRTNAFFWKNAFEPEVSSDATQGPRLTPVSVHQWDSGRAVSRLWAAGPVVSPV